MKKRVSFSQTYLEAGAAVREMTRDLGGDDKACAMAEGSFYSVLMKSLLLDVDYTAKDIQEDTGLDLPVCVFMKRMVGLYASQVRKARVDGARGPAAWGKRCASPVLTPDELAELEVGDDD